MTLWYSAPPDIPGRLVAEYLQEEYANTALKWAMAGRSLDKLASVRTALGIPESVDLVSVDSDDAASVGQMVSDCRVVITTVGPYQLYGEELIKQCAEQGTDYVDLSGEPSWMHEDDCSAFCRRKSLWRAHRP